MSTLSIDSDPETIGESDSLSQFLMFTVNRDVYGINILNIKEIIDIGHITKVPMMSDCIAGVINLRGSVVPIVSLARRFSQQPSEITARSSIIIVEQLSDGEKIEVGIIVDSINKVIEIGSERIDSAPSFGTNIRKEFIYGVGKIEQLLLVLLDMDAVLSIEELSSVSSQHNTCLN